MIQTNSVETLKQTKLMILQCNPANILRNTKHSPSRLLPTFVTEEEEEELLATFRWDETGGGKMKHRQVHNWSYFWLFLFF